MQLGKGVLLRGMSLALFWKILKIMYKIPCSFHFLSSGEISINSPVNMDVLLGQIVDLVVWELDLS